MLSKESHSAQMARQRTEQELGLPSQSLADFSAHYLARETTEIERMAAALKDISAERQRQIECEGWTPKHDDTHVGGELAIAAACYADDRRVFNKAAHPKWPWSQDWWKPTDRRRDLVKAAALIVAEIERIDRLENSKP